MKTDSTHQELITSMPDKPTIYLEYLPLDDLLKRKNPKNPKQHTDDLGASVRRFGYVQPVTLDARSGLIAAGHGRVDALAKMKANGDSAPLRVVVDDKGAWLVPTIMGVSFVSDAERDAFILADNQLTIVGGWDDNLLAEMLSEAQKTGAGLTGTGWNAEDVDALLLEIAEAAQVANPPEAPDARLDARDELQQKWQVALGDVWECASLTVPGLTHRLICGDSLNAATYQTLLGDATVPLLWTDPPWNVSYGEDIEFRPHEKSALGWRKRTILNDNLGAEFPAFLATFCALMKVRVTPGGLVYVVMGGQEWPTVDKALRDTGFHWSSTIVWVKDQFVMGRRDYHTQYEPIWYGWNAADGAGRLHEVKDRTQSDVWQIDRPKKSEAFPIMKPVELVARALKNSSMMGEDVLDPFLGSGTSICAAEQTGRRGLGCELDEGAASVCLQRLEDMGLQPRRVKAGAA